MMVLSSRELLIQPLQSRRPAGLTVGHCSAVGLTVWLLRPVPAAFAGACRKSVEQSVAELGCGHLDLCLIHWPDAWLPGGEEPDTGVTLQETW
jgi:aryl-alcohol dehydrogenase-like predicted oxidoreductase